MNFEKYIKMLKAMLDGSVVSLEVFFLTLLFAIPLALPIAMGRMSKNKLLSCSTNVFLLIIRGTPLMLQLLVVYFGPGIFVRWLNNMGYEVAFAWNRFTAAIIALSINYSAYFAEIYRGGIESIPKGQYEAAKVLGFTPVQTFFKIVLPQVIKRIVPAMGNEVITLVKDTSLAFVLTYEEMFTVAKQIAAAKTTIMPLFVAGVFYFIFNFVVATVMEQLEKKLSYYR